MLRGNNTNNISEAGIRILKEIIFQRVQAFNLVQIFDFITITLETYFEQRLLATAHLRLDSHIALQFKGMGISNLPPAFTCMEKTQPGRPPKDFKRKIDETEGSDSDDFHRFRFWVRKMSKVKKRKQDFSNNIAQNQ